MKKIHSKKDKEKRRKKIFAVVALGLVLLIVVGLTVGTAFFYVMLDDEGERGRLEYKGIEFVQQGGIWYFQFGESQYSLQYNPEETEKIGGEVEKTPSQYVNKPLYFHYESDPIVRDAVLRNIRGIQRTQFACIDEESCEEDYPIKNCSEDNIIITKFSENETYIKQEDNCIHIIAGEQNMTKAGSAFIYKLLGIND